MTTRQHKVRKMRREREDATRSHRARRQTIERRETRRAIEQMRAHAGERLVYA